MKYLITGISGFVGGHYLEYLSEKHPDAQICGTDLETPKFNFLRSSFKKKITVKCGSLLDKKFVQNLIETEKPEYIINLASYSSVAYSWKNPAKCFNNNTNIFLNIAEAVRKTGIKTKILSVGSSEEYGIVTKEQTPLTEDTVLNPANPYAVARVSQEHISKIYAKGFHIPIICTRSFNHIGPRQKDIFVISAFAKQVAQAKKKKRKEIICGDLDIIRDFIDVRDVVEAYDLLLKKGRSGEVYNVCSGEGHRLSEILAMLQKKADTDIPVKKDPDLIRPIDNPVIIGSGEKIKKHTGFRKKYSLPGSLGDMLKYWKDQI